MRCGGVVIGAVLRMGEGGCSEGRGEGGHRRRLLHPPTLPCELSDSVALLHPRSHQRRHLHHGHRLMMMHPPSASPCPCTSPSPPPRLGR